MYFFSKFLTGFVDWNVEKCRQGKNVLSSMLRGDKCSFSNEKCLELTSKKTKSRNVSDFHHFCSIFVKLSIDFMDYIVETPKQWDNFLFR